MKGDKAAASRPFNRKPSRWEVRPLIASSYLGNEERQGGRQEQPRMEIMQGDKSRETRRQGQPRAGQNGDHAGRQGGSQEQPNMEITQGDKWMGTRRQRQPRAGQNGDHAGRQMKGDKAAGAAKSSPEWRSGRETNEGRRRQRHHDHLAIVGICNPVFEK